MRMVEFLVYRLAPMKVYKICNIHLNQMRKVRIQILLSRYSVRKALRKKGKLALQKMIKMLIALSDLKLNYNPIERT
jgi:hypothetical protein